MALDIYTHGRRDQPLVALTFDDGPNPPVTDQILDILAEREVRATFFPIGRWVERWPQAFARMVAAGHVVGNHSYRHDRCLGDFDRAEAVLANVTGKPSRFLRAHFFSVPPVPEVAAGHLPGDQDRGRRCQPGGLLAHRP